MSSGMVARRYAVALLNLAVKADRIEDISTGLDDFADAVAASERLTLFLATPDVSRNDKDAVVAGLLDRIQPVALVSTFIRYLAHKRRILLIGQVREVFHRLADDHQGRAQAEITVSAPLGDGDEERLKILYERISGKEITLHVKVEPEILGGAVTRIGSTVWDGSLRNALQTIQSEISHG